MRFFSSMRSAPCRVDTKQFSNLLFPEVYMALEISETNLES